MNILTEGNNTIARRICGVMVHYYNMYSFVYKHKQNINDMGHYLECKKVLYDEAVTYINDLNDIILEYLKPNCIKYTNF